VKNPKTTLHKMRLVLGLYGQLDRFVKRSGLSRSFVEKLNAGHKRMTQSTAAKLSDVFGVSADWLMSGAVDSPCVTAGGRPFTVESFKRHRARKLAESDERDIVTFYPFGYAAGLMAAAESAVAKGRLAAFAVDADDAFRRLCKRYGFDQATFDGAVAAMAKQPGAYFFEVTDAADSTAEDVRERADVFRRCLLQGVAPRLSRLKTRIVEAEDFFLAHPDARQAAKPVAAPPAPKDKPRPPSRRKSRR